MSFPKTPQVQLAMMPYMRYTLKMKPLFPY
jgi:hypothetical protein